MGCGFDAPIATHIPQHCIFEHPVSIYILMEILGVVVHLVLHKLGCGTLPIGAGEYERVA